MPGDGAIRLTTSLYYTPSGTSIQAEGITPDIKVEPAKIELLKKKKRYTEKNLPGHISNGKKKQDSKKDSDGKGNSSSKLEDDYMLLRAVDLIHALNIYDQARVEFNN